jgi:hypothetical protein
MTNGFHICAESCYYTQSIRANFVRLMYCLDELRLPMAPTASFARHLRTSRPHKASLPVDHSGYVGSVNIWRESLYSSTFATLSPKTYCYIGRDGDTMQICCAGQSDGVVGIYSC